MKTLLKLEELAQVLFSIYLFSLLPFAWWVFPVFFFAPDVSLIGYLAGGRIGAIETTAEDGGSACAQQSTGIDTIMNACVGRNIRPAPA